MVDLINLILEQPGKLALSLELEREEAVDASQRDNEMSKYLRSSSLGRGIRRMGEKTLGRLVFKFMVLQRAWLVMPEVCSLVRSLVTLPQLISLATCDLLPSFMAATSYKLI